MWKTTWSSDWTVERPFNRSTQDAMGRSIAGGNFEFTSVIGSGSDVDSGGMLNVMP